MFPEFDKDSTDEKGKASSLAEYEFLQTES